MRLRRSSYVSAYRIAKCVPAGKGEGLVEGSNADTTLYQCANIIDMALEGVDKLNRSCQFSAVLSSMRQTELTPDASAVVPPLEAIIALRGFSKA